MSELIRTNPGLIVWVVLFGGCTFVCLIVGHLTRRLGASLRPVYWFAGFFALIGVPQFLAHFYFAVSALNQERPRLIALQNLGADSPAETRQESARLLFGADAQSDLIIDARPAFGDALATAEIARFASLPGGESVLLARFPGYSAAEKAWVDYLRYTGLNTLGGKGDSQRGYVVTRPVGDRAYALHIDNMLGVWTGPDDGAIRARMIAGGFKIPRNAPLDALSPSNAAINEPRASPSRDGSVTSISTPYIVAGIAAYLIVVVLYFFRGSAWASGSSPRRNARPISATELAAQLEALNALDIPFRIDQGTRDHELTATWRYADAKWIDLARVRGLRRIHRISLHLDASDHTVRATDSFARFDWSAGRDGAQIDWKTATGITFVHYEHSRVFGLQFDAQGKPTPSLSYAYTFNVQEMKTPLIELITRSGWTWRPVLWQGPRWTRWLTG